MALLTIAKPVELGLDSGRFQKAIDLLRATVEAGKIPGVGLSIGRKGKFIEPVMVGRQHPDRDVPLRKDALFLVASITKPVTVAAAMLLVERGLLALEDRVVWHVPGFTGDGRDDVRIRHLMTHTSGLPDMVASNEELRQKHQPLSAFIEAICNEPLLFPAGTKVNYQSMGTALLAQVIQQISGMTLADFLKKEFFTPLRMYDTSLGWDPAKKDRMVTIRVPAEMQDKDWNWNSPYWLGMGAPWGGLITSLGDFARYCQMMVNNGVVDSVRLLSTASIRLMTANQLAVLPHVPEEDRRTRPWGLGWRLNWPGHAASFGDFLGPRVYGHAGATGTVCWIDPDTEIFCNIFTTQPMHPDDRFLTRLTNTICAAIADGK
jgi:CubicO group peptidase (beta-lactamase class C family)